MASQMRVSLTKAAIMKIMKRLRDICLVKHQEWRPTWLISISFPSTPFSTGNLLPSSLALNSINPETARAANLSCSWSVLPEKYSWEWRPRITTARPLRWMNYCRYEQLRKDDKINFPQVCDGSTNGRTMPLIEPLVRDYIRIHIAWCLCGNAPPFASSPTMRSL